MLYCYYKYTIIHIENSVNRKIQPLPSPHRTWPVPDASSQSQLNLKTDLAKEKDLC